MTPQYRSGETVRFSSGLLRRFASTGDYQIVKRLPDVGDEKQYIIKSALEPRPRHGSTQRAENRRPQPSRAAAHRATDGIGRLFGVVANHRSNQRHCASRWQAKFATEKR